jgi:quercetin dioxygenase-like cupin family protein
MRTRIPGEAVGGRFSVMEAVADTGTSVPLHTHREDEVFHVLEGTLTFEVDGVRGAARAGTIVAIPREIPHRWANFGTEPARFVIFFTPGGIEPMFEQTVGLAPEQLVACAAGYGTVILGPPMEASVPGPNGAGAGGDDTAPRRPPFAPAAARPGEA